MDQGVGVSTRRRVIIVDDEVRVVDAQGNKISGLKVKSVFGSDRAKLVAPPGESSIDPESTVFAVRG